MKEPKDIKILIVCEESGIVTNEFRKLGFDCWSNDILPTSGNFPEWHLQMDCFEAIKLKEWNLMIGHPPCTYLCLSGNRWFNINKYGEKALDRIQKSKEALQFFIKIYNSPIKYICLENPLGYANSNFRKPDQIIQPYYFGDTFQKTTCLWLKNLPKLLHFKTDDLFDNKTHVDKGEMYISKSGKIMPKWYATLLPSPDRAKIRSKTFPGFAKAMATQWSEYILNC